jgi:hypothetical protein
VVCTVTATAHLFRLANQRGRGSKTGDGAFAGKLALELPTAPVIK